MSLGLVLFGVHQSVEALGVRRELVTPGAKNLGLDVSYEVQHDEGRHNPEADHDREDQERRQDQHNLHGKHGTAESSTRL